ncbi:MAG TPA: STAS domain-containing protein [Streptosporangiaceae bacterium]
MSGERQPVWVGRVAIMTVPAEVDTSNAAQLREDLLSAVAQGASLVIADMSATTFCDSAGVAALVRVVRQAAASGSGLRIAASAPVVTRVLALTGVDKLIEIYPSVAAALGDDIAADATDETAHAVLPPQADPEESAPQPG